MATNQRYVSTNADLKVARSRFPLNRRTKWSYFHGYLHPIGSPIEVLPGDTFKAKLSVFIRMSTPIVPFIDDVRFEADAFFVPKRILWNKTKQFYGEAPSFGVATKVYEPRKKYLNVGVDQLTTNLLKSESITAAFGLQNDGVSGSTALEFNVLPIRALFSIYNEYYRDENFQDQYTWDKDGAGSVNTLASLGVSTIGGTSLLPQVNKDRDVITSILPWPQKGDPVQIGVIGGNLPVITGDVNTDLVTSGTGQYLLKSGVQPVIFGNKTSLGTSDMYHYLGMSSKSSTRGEIFPSSETVFGADDEATMKGPIAPVNLYAQVSNATAVRINDLLYALAYQDFLARSAHFGTRYKEYIYSMFGTKIPDLSDDVPEYLGRLKMNINVQQVVQTTGFSSSSSTELGALGAYSNSGKSDDMFMKSFTEPGYIVFVGYTKHQRTYSSGVDRVFVKNELLDYYQPPFANIPDVPFGSFNVWIDPNAETSLGFQEPWYDYRALQDRSYGMMNPMIDTLGEIWTLAEKWTAKPTIAGDFMKEDRDCIARVLATGTNGPDYLCDALLELDATRVMPLYSSGRLERF